MKKDKYKQTRLQFEQLRIANNEMSYARQKAYKDFLVQVRECELAHLYGRRPPDRLTALIDLRRSLNDLILTYTPQRRVNAQPGKSRLWATLAEIFIPDGN